jgi:transcriptional regulator with XRE-family HTH domain
VAVSKQKGTGLKEQLREAIRQSGQSLNRLSGVCGIGRDRLSRFVRGERGIGLDAAEKLCAALGLRLTPDPDARPPAPPGPNKGKGSK